ncbi:MAG: Ca-activated chloride channel family protein, partial [Candidatus Omnitrophota bacterium]
MNFQREPWLLLLLALPVLLPVFLRGQRMGEKMRAVLFRRARVTRPIWPTTVALALGLLGLILALARPGWNPRQEPLVRETRDVVFVLDVSRSMLARDRVPNRLENAKATIISCLDELGEEQRVGLVAFAGTTSIKCP